MYVASAYSCIVSDNNDYLILYFEINFDLPLDIFPSFSEMKRILIPFVEKNQRGCA